MKRYNVKSIRGKTKRVVLIGLTFFITYILVVTSIAPKKYDLSEGDIAPVDIKASRETVDEASSKEKLDEALENLDKQYTLKNDVKKQAETNVSGLIEKVISVKDLAANENEKVSNLQKYEQISLTADECKVLLALSKDDLLSLEKNASDVLKNVYSRNIEDANDTSLKYAITEATTEIDSLSLTNNLKDILKKIITSQIQPNFFYDEEKTEEKKKEVEKNVEKVVIKKNQIIVKEGEPVTANQIQVLTELGLLSKDSSDSFNLLYFILIIFVGLILYIEHSYIKLNYKEIYTDIKKLTLINLLNVFSLVLATVVGLVAPYLIPLACGPILMTLLINYKISIFVSILNALIIGAIAQFDPTIMILAVLNALLGATVLKKIQQRNDILYASIKILILSVICSFSIGVIISSNIKDILLNTGCVAVGVFISGILAIGVLPFLEASFDLVTTLKLLELSNPNSPLMKKLLMEAPGTYHHSMVVANLAEMAAEEVNADPVVARIGAYYHDIGKTVRPYFFKENQMAKENPHDKISPNLSTLIIVSHVKDGVELAKEHKLPKVIQDLIVEHHGTTLVKYFYYTVKNNSEHPEEVKEEDYRYLGPIPSSKESGILMLADSTEAAVRSINEPTKGKIEEMVNNIIKDKLYSGQLDNCDLTLKDLEKIRKCFLKALNGIYHQRIEYPAEKIKDLNKGKEK